MYLRNYISIISKYYIRTLPKEYIRKGFSFNIDNQNRFKTNDLKTLLKRKIATTENVILSCFNFLFKVIINIVIHSIKHNKLNVFDKYDKKVLIFLCI